MKLLRFFTAGNVDDGKSTLIGRLLYDSNCVATDILETLTTQSKSRGSDTEIDLAMLTDGLRAEREQGITIDVAYKYFTTNLRKFIIADTPGHIQYTRNMFTGASSAELAIILIDARNGITDQTKRHSILSSILGMPHVVVCINKMDLVNYSETIYNELENTYTIFAKQIGLKKISFIPVSALVGDNVVKASEKMLWYSGPTLLEFLETVEITEEQGIAASRFQVQYVIRPQTKELHDYRGFSGKVLSGSYKKGQRVLILPSGQESQIEKIEINQQEVKEAGLNSPIVLHLKDNIDISRGNSIVSINNLPQTEKEITATICWMDNQAFIPGQKLLLQQNSFRTRAVIKDILSKIDIHSFFELESDGSMRLNDISKVLIRTSETVTYDSYSQNRRTGSFILINENTNNTVAAGIL